MRPACALGFEPPMFRGLSGSELTAVIGLSLLPGLFVGVVTFVLTGSLLWILPSVVMVAFVTVLCAGTALRRLKRNRPPNWYLQSLARYLGGRADLVCRAGYWRIDR